MEASTSEALFLGLDGVDDSYRTLPPLYLGLLALWSLSTFFWAASTWRNRHFQLNNLQWVLASVPLIKVLQLGMSLLFWHSCFKLDTCSLWMSFGVYVSGILFQTASFVCFLIISHGYCIVCEHLSMKEQRTTASLGCILYLTLVGYRADVPYFTVFMLLSYFVAFYMIFHLLSQNLLVLSEQLNFSFVQDDNVHSMQSTMHRKYTMFKWIFRPQEVSPLFFVMPAKKSRMERALPPVYSLEIDAADFKNLASEAWHIGVPTSLPRNNQQSPVDSVLVIVQHPRSENRAPLETVPDQMSAGRAVVADATTTGSRSEADKRGD